MKKEDIKVKSQYFKRSYFALDGLWFMMVEKYFSLEDALKIDEEVWKILPKIQAREVRRLLNLKENTLQNFIQVLEVELEVEDYQYQKKITGPRLCFLIKECPWYEIIKKSRKEYLLLKGIS
ncbi:hypothetical protein J7K28_09075 [Candidatus Aerophobetes bacterium]|nr:hypothetical protein [Candidatus Aerophobetes bacterium]